MPVIKQQRLSVACPACGHQQMEPAAALSTNCRKCGKYISVPDVLHPAEKPALSDPKRRRIACFECGTEQEVSVSAQSSMCRRCSRHIDLTDYRITSAVSKNFRTKGRFVVEPKGYVFNTEAVVGEAVIKGRFLGKLRVEGDLTIYSTAEIKGTVSAGRLIIPATQTFSWKEPLEMGAAEIHGELVADLNVAGRVVLGSAARFFGDLLAAELRMEEGAVFVGSARVGSPLSPTPA